MKIKLLFAILFLTAFCRAQIVDIPDANFKAKLIALGVDTNADGNRQVTEALARTALSLSGSQDNYLNITDLTGIEAFTNLNILPVVMRTFRRLTCRGFPIYSILLAIIRI